MSASVNTRICFATRHPGALRRSQNPRKDQTTVPKAPKQLSDKRIAAYSKHTWKSTAVLLFWAGWSKAKKNYRIFMTRWADVRPRLLFRPFSHRTLLMRPPCRRMSGTSAGHYACRVGHLPWRSKGLCLMPAFLLQMGTLAGHDFASPLNAFMHATRLPTRPTPMYMQGRCVDIPKGNANRPWQK